MGSSIGCGRWWHWLFSSLAARGGGSTGRGARLWGGAPIFGVDAEGISPEQVRESGKRSVAPVARFMSTGAPQWSSGTCRRHQTVAVTGYPREGPCQRRHSGELALEALHSGCWRQRMGREGHRCSRSPRCCVGWAEEWPQRPNNGELAVALGGGWNEPSGLASEEAPAQ
jgi:hypothetical protein